MNQAVGASLAREQNEPESANYWFQGLFANIARVFRTDLSIREQGSLLQGHSKCRN